jgi:acid phosphatase
MGQGGIMCENISELPFRNKELLLIRGGSPFVSFESISLNGTRLAKIQRLLEFENDVKTNTLPQYCHISPNVFNDGHDTSLDYAAQWSKDFLIPLLANEAFMNRTLILLTYDEGGNFTLPNRVVSILLGGSVPPELKGTTDDTAYTHYSILSTLQNNWNLPNLGRYDVGANVFNLVAKTTGYINHQPVNIHSANNSRSYEGFLNEDPARYKPIPPPNIKLIGAGGQAVERMVKLQWVKAEGEFTPYDGSGDFADGGDGITNQNAPVYKPQGPAAAAKYVRTTGASAGRLEVYTGVWVYVYVLALAFSAL